MLKLKIIHTKKNVYLNKGVILSRFCLFRNYAKERIENRKDRILFKVMKYFVGYEIFLKGETTLVWNITQNRRL